MFCKKENTTQGISFQLGSAMTYFMDSHTNVENALSLQEYVSL